MTGTAYVHGIALSGEALAVELQHRGWRLVLADDAPDAGVRVEVGEPRVVMWAPEGKTADIAVHLHSQSADIAQGVDSAGNKDEGAGDQGIMFGYACRETDSLMPAPLHYAHEILRIMRDRRKAGEKSAQGLLPDAKSQVTLRYVDGKPVGCTAVVVSTQHSPKVDQDAVREMLLHPAGVSGLSDGGAHVGTICDASFPTTLLAWWCRDRPHGRLAVEEVIKRQSHDTAAWLGLRDRGVLAPGLRADVNIIDFDSLSLHRPEMHYDLPAGGKRLLQRATGYRHTFVDGVETYRDGAATGAKPGRLVRGPQ